MRAAALAVLVAASLGLVVLGAEPTAVAAKRPSKPPKPVISKIDPRNGPTTGGTVVTIKGKHLKTTKKVLFGKAKATRLKVTSDKKLIVTAPPHAAGAVDVTVKSRGGRSAKSAAARFTYALEKPQVTAVAPNTGPDTGGTRVTVTGTGFAGVTQVSFGGVPGTGLTISSPTQLSVTSPETSAGLIHVNVTNPAGTSPSKSGDIFRFTNVPRSIVAPLPPGAAADPDTRLAEVVCPSGGGCVAVGSYLRGSGPASTRHPLIEQRTGTTTWAAAEPGLPGDADPAHSNAALFDLSCASATFCAAVGSYQRSDTLYYPLVETWNGSTWTPHGVDLPLGSNGASDIPISAIDCPTATACQGVGHDFAGVAHQILVLTFDGATWSVDVVTPPAGLVPDLAALSCPTATYCLAVGRSDNGALGQVPVVATLSGASWTVAEAAHVGDENAVPDGYLEDVSCTEVSTCTAVGIYQTTAPAYLGLVLQVQPSATTALAVAGPAGSGADPKVDAHSVTCLSGLQCSAVGSYGDPGDDHALTVALSSIGAAGSEAPLPAGGTPPAALSDVACVAVNACVAVGGHAMGGVTQVPLLESLSGTGWTARTAPTPPGWLDGSLDAVATDGPTGVGVGHWSDGTNTQGLITVDIPLG
jgi:hypothetical protein